MANRKKPEIKEEPEPTSLRRSSRSTRGSVKPVVDLTQDSKDVDDVDEADPDEEYKAPSTRRESSRKSVVKKKSTRDGPAKRGPVKETVKQELEVKGEKVKSEPVDNEAEDKHELAETSEGSSTYYELSETEMKDINHAFDMNRIGDEQEQLDAEGLRTAIRSLGFEPRGDEIKKLLKMFAKKGNKVNRDGFHKIMATKYGSSPGTKLNNLNDEISRVFNLLDLDKTGLITLANLKSISKELNEELTEEELQEMIAEADLDGDLKINKQEFQNIMIKTSLY